MPPISHRQVWAIAGPMILSNVSIPLLGMVDTAVMGHLPAPHYLGAVAVGASLFSVLFLGLNFLRMGTTGLIAQFHGRGDYAALRGTLVQGLALALVLAGLLLALQGPVGHFALGLMAPDPLVLEQARLYFQVRIWSAPVVLANYVLLGLFLGLGDGRSPLVMLLVVNASNIVLDLLLVVGLGMTADGVALASCLAEALGTVTALALARRQLRRHPGPWQPRQWRNRQRLGRLLGVNLNIFIRTLLLVGALAFFTAQGARLGEVMLAANALLLNFQHILSYALDGLAHAAEALVGRAVGAEDREGLGRAVRLSLLWSLGVAVVFALGFALAGPGLIRLLTDLPRVRETALEFLPWMVLSPLVSVWSFLWDGVFIGATRAREMRDAMILSVLGVYLPAWWLLQPLGNHGLWAAFTLLMVARGVSMGWIYRRWGMTFLQGGPGG